VSTAPPNDLFAYAQVASGTTGSVTGPSVQATKEAGEPNHAGNPGGRSVWYSWRAPATGTVTFETVGSSFDTLLAAYRGGGVASLTRVAANDDIGAGNYQSRIKFTASAGVTYRIAVDGYSGASGSVRLAWR
jgi:hypothetical protein